MTEEIARALLTDIATCDELMKFAKLDSTLFFKSCRLYRIFTYKPIGSVSFTDPASMNCCGIMSDIMDKDSPAVHVS